MSEEQLALLEEVFVAVFELSPDTDVRTMSREEIPAWDSLGHVSLMTALESEFEIEIAAGDSIEIMSFELAAEIVAELLVEGTP